MRGAPECVVSPHAVWCLRRQILAYEGEMERAQGQLEVELQTLEEEKNRIIEEAFIRAESEMKSVHENLAGQSQTNTHIFLSFLSIVAPITCNHCWLPA